MLPYAFFGPLLNSWRVRDCWRVSVRSDGGVRIDGSIGTIEESGRFISSRSSFVVNAASKGPRLAIIDTCLIADWDRVLSTNLGTSYWVRVETGVRSMRATSRETFPFPMIETWVNLSNVGDGGWLGCWVYQCTRERAGIQWFESGRAEWKVGSVQPVANRTCE